MKFGTKCVQSIVNRSQLGYKFLKNFNKTRFNNEFYCIVAQRILIDSFGENYKIELKNA